MSKQLVYGFNVVETLLQRSPERIVRVFFDKSRRDRRARDLQARLDQLGLAWEQVAPAKIEGLVQDVHHQGIAAEALGTPTLDENSLLSFLHKVPVPFLCVLEQIQDPRNLGACVRSAVAAGVDAVVLSRQDSCGMTALVRKTAAGAAELVPVARVANLTRVLNRLQTELGIWIVGTDGAAADSLYSVPLTGPVAMVFGSEGTGLRKLTQKNCDHLVHIPMPGQIDSLNVSVACGVGLFEAVRQQRAVEPRS